jgi:hypothetical protein
MVLAWVLVSTFLTNNKYQSLVAGNLLFESPMCDLMVVKHYRTKFAKAEIANFVKSGQNSKAVRRNFNPGPLTGQLSTRVLTNFGINSAPSLLNFVRQGLHVPVPLVFLREGPCSQGASWVVCGSGVPQYDFLNLYCIFNSRFCISFSWKTARTKDRQGVDDGWGGSLLNYYRPGLLFADFGGAKTLVQWNRYHIGLLLSWRCWVTCQYPALDSFYSGGGVVSLLQGFPTFRVLASTRVPSAFNAIAIIQKPSLPPPLVFFLRFYIYAQWYSSSLRRLYYYSTFTSSTAVHCMYTHSCSTMYAYRYGYILTVPLGSTK